MRSRRILLVLGLLIVGGSVRRQRRQRRRRRAPAAGDRDAAPPSGTDAPTAGEKIKIGLITKFPVDFFFTIENAAKDWAASHPEVELITGQGKAGNDHEGQIAIIESMVAQGVKGIAVTPTGPQVQPALDAAVAAGRQDRPDRQRPARLERQDRGRRHRQPRRRRARRASGSRDISRPATRWPSSRASRASRRSTRASRA